MILVLPHSVILPIPLAQCPYIVEKARLVVLTAGYDIKSLTNPERKKA